MSWQLPCCFFVLALSGNDTSVDAVLLLSLCLRGDSSPHRHFKETKADRNPALHSLVQSLSTARWPKPAFRSIRSILAVRSVCTFWRNQWLLHVDTVSAWCVLMDFGMQKIIRKPTAVHIAERSSHQDLSFAKAICWQKLWTCCRRPNSRHLLLKLWTSCRVKLRMWSVILALVWKRKPWNPAWHAWLLTAMHMFWLITNLLLSRSTHLSQPWATSRRKRVLSITSFLTFSAAGIREWFVTSVRWTNTEIMIPFQFKKSGWKKRYVIKILIDYCLIRLFKKKNTRLGVIGNCLVIMKKQSGVINVCHLYPSIKVSEYIFH